MSFPLQDSQDFYIKILSLFQAENEKSLQELAVKLEQNGVLHKLWIEQPENIPTCIAVKPHPKEEIQKYFKKFKLFKGAAAETK